MLGFVFKESTPLDSAQASNERFRDPKLSNVQKVESKNHFAGPVFKKVL